MEPIARQLRRLHDHGMVVDKVKMFVHLIGYTADLQARPLLSNCVAVCLRLYLYHASHP